MNTSMFFIIITWLLFDVLYDAIPDGHNVAKEIVRNVKCFFTGIFIVMLLRIIFPLQ